MGFLNVRSRSNWSNNSNSNRNSTNQIKAVGLHKREDSYDKQKDENTNGLNIMQQQQRSKDKYKSSED